MQFEREKEKDEGILPITLFWSPSVPIMDIFLGIFKSLRIPQGLNRKEKRRGTIMLKSQSPNNSIGMVYAESMALTVFES